jgi:hypothetical protein
MKNETIKKYQDALEGVELRCKMNAKVTNHIIAEEYYVGNSFVSYAKQLGYILPNGRGYYKWCEESVNRELAERLYKYTKLKIQNSLDKVVAKNNYSSIEIVKPFKPKATSVMKIDKPKTEQPKRKVQPVKTETISWFWGLYTKTVKG